MDLGDHVNPAPIRDKLILGAGSQLLDNEDVLVTQLVPKKPFAFDPFFMRTKYRFIEGYQGNDTVRGWREYDSIYHAVFADMRGAATPKARLTAPSRKGSSCVLRFRTTKISGSPETVLTGRRPIQDFASRAAGYGPFRVTITAAKYNDGLLLDPGAKPQNGPESVVYREPKNPHTFTIPKAGPLPGGRLHPAGSRAGAGCVPA